MKFNAKIEGIEVRGYEEKANKMTGRPYLLVRVEDETGQALEFADKSDYDDRKPLYKRGQEGDLIIRIDKARDWTNFEIVDFIKKK